MNEINRLAITGLILFLLSSCINTLYAVNKLDSLAGVVDRMDNTTDKVDELLKLSERAVSAQQLKAVKFAQKAVFLAQKIDYPLGVAKAHYQLMLAYYYMGNSEDALNKGEQALKKYQSLQNKLGTGKTYHIIGKIYSYAGKHDLAHENIHKGLKLFKEIKATSWMGDSYSALGMFKFKLNDFKEGIPLIKIAISYYQSDSIQNSKSLIRAYILLGIANNGLQRYEESIVYNKKALRLAKATDNLYNITVSKTNLGWTYYLIDEYQKATKYCSEGLQNAELQNDKHSIAHNYKCLGAVYTELEQFTLAKENLNEALSIVQSMKTLTEEAEIYQLYSKLYEKQNDDKLALKYYQQFHAISDTINNNIKEDQLKQLALKFKNSQLEKSFDFKSMTSVQRRNLNIALVVALILGLLILGLLYRFYIQRKEHTAQLRQEADKNAKSLARLNSEMEKFNYIASNDLKQPMRNVMSFAGLLNKKLQEKKEDQALIDYSAFVLNGAKQMYDVIVGVLEFSSIDHTTTQIKSLDTHFVIESAVVSLGDFVERQNAEVQISPNVPEQILSNETHLRLIFKHLIKNGIMYNQSDKPVVKIDYEDGDADHIFKISDNGIGIDENSYRYIFEMFKSLHSKEVHQGSGMGLSLTQKLIEALEGEIHVESEIGKGSVFVVTLPK